MSFEKMLDELETMAKALPSDAGEDDENIQAAAAEGSEGDGGDSGEGAAAAEAEAGADAGDGAESAAAADDDEGEDEGMAKSFSFTLEDGTVVEAQDGTELVKALMNRVEKNEQVLGKSLQTAVTLIKSQGDLIKSLQEKVTTLAGQGRGRKAVVSVTEKPSTLAKSEPAEEGMTGSEFMAKAMTAQAAGRITGMEVARAESHLNKGMQVPADIVARVIQ